MCRRTELSTDFPRTPRFDFSLRQRHHDTRRDEEMVNFQQSYLALSPSRQGCWCRPVCNFYMKPWGYSSIRAKTLTALRAKRTSHTRERSPAPLQKTQAKTCVQPVLSVPIRQRLHKNAQQQRLVVCDSSDVSDVAIMLLRRPPALPPPPPPLAPLLDSCRPSTLSPSTLVATDPGSPCVCLCARFTDHA